MKSLEDIRIEADQAVRELMDQAHLSAGAILIVGCSTSEIQGEKIGTHASLEIAETLFGVFKNIADTYQIYLAFQCCEHLNRAIVIDKKALRNEIVVNVVPWEHAGGSMATVAYRSFPDPQVVEFIQADAGIDIGDTFIGMHMKHVCVPVRLSVKEIGEAHVTAARVRPKSIGGPRARYDETLM